MSHYIAYGENMASSLSGQFSRMLTYLTYPSHLPDTITEKDSLFRRQHVMEALDDSIREQEQALAPPLWVPPQHSLLFETTTKKLHKHRSSLEKQLLLKQLYSKLQTTKRHGIIILPTPQKSTPVQTSPNTPQQPSSELAYLRNAGHQKYYQRRMMPNQGLLSFPSVNTATPLQRKRASPPSPTSPPYAPKSFCNSSTNDDDDNVPLGTLIPSQHQQKQLHRIGICVI